VTKEDERDTGKPKAMRVKQLEGKEEPKEEREQQEKREWRRERARVRRRVKGKERRERKKGGEEEEGKEEEGEGLFKGAYVRELTPFLRESSFDSQFLEEGERPLPDTLKTLLSACPSWSPQFLAARPHSNHQDLLLSQSPDRPLALTVNL